MKDIELNEMLSHDVNVDKFLSGSDLGEVLKVIFYLSRSKIRDFRNNSKKGTSLSRNCTSSRQAASSRNSKGPKVLDKIIQIWTFSSRF